MQQNPAALMKRKPLLGWTRNTLTLGYSQFIPKEKRSGVPTCSFHSAGNAALWHKVTSREMRSKSAPEEVSRVSLSSEGSQLLNTNLPPTGQVLKQYLR